MKKVHAFLGELTPAERRELRKTPLSALRASFPKISLRCDFREPCLFSGHAFIKMPRLHLSCKSAAAQIECAGAKAWFCLREYLFYVLTICFELTKQIVEI